MIEYWKFAIAIAIMSFSSAMFGYWAGQSNMLKAIWMPLPEPPEKDEQK